MRGPIHTPRETASYLERDLTPLVATGLDVDQAVAVVAMQIERPAWKVKQMLAQHGSGVLDALSKDCLRCPSGTYPCRVCEVNDHHAGAHQ